MARVGLSLSGGGYRAAAFHLGTLRALNNLGVLNKIDVVSTISGGSITGAAWLLSQKPYPKFEEDMINALHNKSVIRFVFTSRSFLFLALIVLLFLGASGYFLWFTGYPALSFLVLGALIYVLFRFQFKLFPVSKEIGRAYDKFFFNNKTLRDLPERPDLAIGSTNLLTTRPFTFSRRKMGDSYYDTLTPPIKFKHENFPIAQAVVASSCVPFAFTPVTISKEFYANPSDFEKTDTKLVDGGVFDNQGIHKVTNENSSWYCNIVLVSDAGNKLPFKQSFNNTIILLIRTVDVFMDRIKDFQIAQNLYKRDLVSDKEIAYISLGWDLENCIPGFVNNLIAGQIPDMVVDAHLLMPEWVKNPEAYIPQITQHLKERTNFKSRADNKKYISALALARDVGTNLTKLSFDQINALADHAELFTELQAKLYVPFLVQNR